MELKLSVSSVFEGENNSRALNITVDDDYAGYEIRIAFLTPAGCRCMTPAIELENNEAQYYLPFSLLDAPGVLLAQIVAENDEQRIIKSEVYAFDVDKSIIADSGVDGGGELISLPGLKEDVDALYGELENYALLSDIPTKTSELTNDSGYLTEHQDISGKQDVLTFDDAPTANSNNPVKSGGVYTALAAKQAAINTNTKSIGTCSSGTNSIATTEFVQQNKGNFFAKCTNLPDTVALEATCYNQQGAAQNTGFIRHRGVLLTVYFEDTVRVSNATLNVNSTGAAAIKLNGQSLPAGVIHQGSYCSFVYDGAYWVMTDIAIATSAKYGWVKLYNGVDSSSSAMAATANAVKTVKDAIPTKVSDLTNDSGFLADTTIQLAQIANMENNGAEGEAGLIGGANAYEYYFELGDALRAQMVEAARNPLGVYLDNIQFTVIQNTAEGEDENSFLFMYNLTEDTSGQTMLGLAVEDSTKPFYFITINVDGDSSTGYTVVCVSGTSLDDETWTLWRPKKYLSDNDLDYKPTQNSAKPIMSGAMYEELRKMLPYYDYHDAGKILSVNASGELEWISLS